MKFKHPMTAAELMAKLDADPDFQRRKAEKNRRLAEREASIAAAMQPIMNELHNSGVIANSLEEMTQRYAPLSPQIVQVLLSWLPRIQEDRIRESLIRSLGAAKEPFDGRLLVDCFLNDISDTLRWPIANTMAISRPFGIEDWLIEVVKKRSFGNARGILLLALARIVPTDRSLPILLSLLDELPGYAATAIGEVGRAVELNELQSRVNNVQGWEKTEFLKAIRKINKRGMKRGHHWV